MCMCIYIYIYIYISSSLSLSIYMYIYIYIYIYRKGAPVGDVRVAVEHEAQVAPDDDQQLGAATICVYT